jgi:hypothetical protein
MPLYADRIFPSTRSILPQQKGISALRPAPHAKMAGGSRLSDVVELLRIGCLGLLQHTVGVAVELNAIDLVHRTSTTGDLLLIRSRSCRYRLVDRRPCARPYVFCGKTESREYPFDLGEHR